MAYVAPTNTSTGDVLTASRYNQDVVENVSQLYTTVRRLGSVTLDGTYSASAGSFAAAAEIFASDISFTAVAATAYRIELTIPFYETATTAASTIYVAISDGSTAQLSAARFGSGDGTRSNFGHVEIVHYWTPGAGAKTVNARAWNTTATGTLYGRTAFGEGVMRLSVYGPDIT